MLEKGVNKPHFRLAKCGGGYWRCRMKLSAAEGSWWSHGFGQTPKQALDNCWEGLLINCPDTAVRRHARSFYPTGDHINFYVADNKYGGKPCLKKE